MSGNALAIDAQVKHEQAYALYRQGPAASIITAIVGGGVVVAMWNHASHTILLIWYGLSLTNQIVRVALTAAFQKSRPQIGKTDIWVRRYQWSMIVGGVLFGSMPIIMFPENDPLGQAILLFVTCMMTVGSIAANAYHWPTMRAYLGCILLPMLLRLALMPGFEYGVMTFIFSLFALSVFLFSRNQSVLLLESIKIRYQNLDLVEALKIKTGIAEAAQQKAEQMSLAKSKFFAAASHDLRQPLQALELFAASLQKAHYPPEDACKVDQILSSVDALSSLFDDLLDISKLDAGYVRPVLGHFSADSLFARLNSIFSPLAQEKKLKLKFFKTNTTLHSDPVLLERVLGNLISNAIRCTTQGGVLVGCRHRDDSIRLEVWDTGIGIPADKFEQIFDEFYQIDNPERDRRLGMGLGLATVKRIAALLDCRISLDSKLAVTNRSGGSVFRVEVSAGEAALVMQAMAAEDDDATYVDVLNGRVILVIDDEGSVREGLAEVMGSWGCRVVAVPSAQAALEELARQGMMPEAMIADYRLREHENGINAIARLREKFGAELPALLVSGDTAAELFKAAQQNNLPLLQKPVRAVKLRATLAHFFSR